MKSILCSFFFVILLLSGCTIHPATPYSGFYQRGDARQFYMPDRDGREHEIPLPYGPGGSDLSFLDTKKKRAGFD